LDALGGRNFSVGDPLGALASGIGRHPNFASGVSRKIISSYPRRENISGVYLWIRGKTISLVLEAFSARLLAFARRHAENLPMNTLFPRHVASIAVVSIAIFGVAAGSSSVDARTAKAAKHAKISAMAAPPQKQRSHPMRYYGGPKSPMWPAVD
jgi:hypothetical protein